MKYTIALKNLPFEPQKNQIIYVESSYNEVVNKFIVDNYEHIRYECTSHGLEFCYLPKLIEEVGTEALFYNVPYAKTKADTIGSDYLLQFMAKSGNKELIPPSLLYLYDDAEVSEEVVEFKAMSITDQDEIPTLEDIFRMRLEEIFGEAYRVQERISFEIGNGPRFSKEIPDEHKGGNIRFSIDRAFPPEEKRLEGSEQEEEYNKAPSPERSGIKKKIHDTFNSIKKCLTDQEEEHEYVADEKFDDESKQIVKDVKEKVEQLKLRGINFVTILQLIMEEEPLSRLVITKDFRIFLPDYNNMEIEMTPLPKAVFILFLRHPEGIVFKWLPDYREELKEIYLKMKPAGWTAAVEQSIKALTDPYNNSINEKCARIREAFVGKFKEHLAENYFVTGKRGEAKKITLPRELVTIEE